MELINQSSFPTKVFAALDKGGREHLVIVAKATYHFGGGRPSELVQEDGRPIAVTDVFVGQPGLSAPLYEADLVLRKQRCDVIVDATAHAPGGRPVTELPVGVRVGQLSKQFLAVGDRVWRRGAFGVSATKPQPFTSMRLHYGRAFGGSSPKNSRMDGRAEGDTYLANPIGTGYASDLSADVLEGMALPNTEDVHDRVTAPNGVYKPLALGPIGRHWDPRRKYAGTYDASWRGDGFPFLPDDFNEAFFQSAPPDQQIPFPKGGEQVVLQNLVPGQPLVTFELPQAQLLAKVLHRSHAVTELSPVIDTLFIEPGESVLSLVFRATLPLDPRRDVR